MSYNFKATLPARPVTDRERQLMALQANAPMQSKGKPVEDAGFLPLFIAANEPAML